MKAKLTTATLIGLLACSLARAQTSAADPSAGATTPVAADSAAAAPTAADPAAIPPAATTVAAAEPAAAAQPVGTETAPAATETTAAPATATETTAAQPASAAPAAETAAAPAAAESNVSSDATPATNAIIPLIQFQDVTLTTAIENLARQAGLNYILDPKVTFGQPDEKGQTRPQPNINLRWENLTAGQALTALLTTYNLQLVDDPRTKVSRITVKDPAAPDPLVTKVIQLKYAGPSNVLSSVQSTLTDKRSKVVADIRTSQLVVVATDKEQQAVEELLAHLDTPTKQVLIEAKILETTVNPKTVKGIDWSGTLSAQRITMGNDSLPGVAPTPPITYTDPITGAPNTIAGTPGSIGGILNDPKLIMSTAGKFFQPSTAFLNADGLDVALSFLNNSSDTKVISEPRMVTLDNQKATIDVGLMYPIVNVQASTANTTGGSQITYSNLTVNLDVTPRITANDFVEMRVEQSILRLGPKFSSTVDDKKNEVDSFFTRRAATAVLIPSGNTLVMGGLISDESINANTKVPVLGDIPVLGYAFRKDAKSRNKQNLIIFITPTIVQDNDFQRAKSTFLKSTGDEEVKEEWSAWDSGKPYDWSKPKKKPAAQ
jgi:type II secretory pathway component GspD/PulD (secretin)